MHKGTVKIFKDGRGFGFITDSATNEDVFFHVSGLIDKVKRGDIVTFDKEPGKKGINAVNIRVA